MDCTHSFPPDCVGRGLLREKDEFKKKKNEELAAMAEKRRAESYRRRAIRKAAGKESARA